MSLLETIIVLFIISLMMALLFPALMSARAHALKLQCQENVHGLGIALGQSIYTLKRFPQPNHWTVDVLRWVEEQPLADAMAHGVPTGLVLARPKIMQCPSQSNDQSTVAEVGICHYVLVVDRSIPYDRPERVSWVIVDRPAIGDKDSHDPWYIGPEITYAQEQAMFTTREGPHQSGVYFDSNGRTFPVK